jgi:DNA repair photolyase
MAVAIQSKTILSKVKADSYFGLTYNMNLYRGCQHGCIYCDSRSTCYQLGPLSHIRYKANALELLEKELRGKKQKGTIGFGSMNDPYMPVEKDLELSRNALKLIAKYKFPVHIITKSNLITRDVDLLGQISKTYAAVSFTITTSDDDLSGIIEPNAPKPSLRFEAIRFLSDNGIYCGMTLMPVLPFINDTEENIRQLLIRAIEAGVQYIIPFMGLTLREGSREYFYQKLEALFPGTKDKYISTYGNRYNCNSPNANDLYKLLYALMKEFNIPSKMVFYKSVETVQQKLF